MEEEEERKSSQNEKRKNVIVYSIINYAQSSGLKVSRGLLKQFYWAVTHYNVQGGVFWWGLKRALKRDLIIF